MGRLTIRTWATPRVREWLRGRRLYALLLVGLAAAVAYPFTFAHNQYLISLAIQVMILAIFAMSLDLLLGYTGLASLGHAAFYGLGGYLVGYLARAFSANLLVTLPLVLAGTALAALTIGFFALRTAGLSFLMFTLATAQMLYGIAIKWTQVTGGSDGLSGVPRPAIGLGQAVYRFGTDQRFYFLTLVIFVLATWLMRRLVGSPFGHTLIGIKANEPRMRALGYNTWRYKIAVFVVAGVFAGLAGFLSAHYNRFASPQNLYWTVSGLVLVMVIIGGAGSLIGPALGAALVHLLQAYASTYTERNATFVGWQTVMGLVFVFFVMFVPQGLIGLFRRRWGRPVAEESH